MKKTEELETLTTKLSVNQKATIKPVDKNYCFNHTLPFVNCEWAITGDVYDGAQTFRACSGHQLEAKLMSIIGPCIIWPWIGPQISPLLAWNVHNIVKTTQNNNKKTKVWFGDLVPQCLLLWGNFCNFMRKEKEGEEQSFSFSKFVK